jgi:hypothetical protein
MDPIFAKAIQNATLESLLFFAHHGCESQPPPESEKQPDDGSNAKIQTSTPVHTRRVNLEYLLCCCVAAGSANQIIIIGTTDTIVFLHS